MSGPARPVVLPPYPYDRIDEIRSLAAASGGEVVDLSIGTPCDPPPPAVVAALATSGAERGYPAGAGSAALREAASGWLQRRFGVDVDPSGVAACVGTKELVASVPAMLGLGRPDSDTVLYPEVSYPTYAMGAKLAGLRAVPVAVDEHWRIDLASVSADDAARALCLWVNTPGNPAGALDDLTAAAAWGRDHGVVVLSDECYAEFTWDGPPRTILASGTEGVVAVHSLSKRSNLAGLRVGFYAGDDGLVSELRELRRHAGLMVAGPVQAAAALALGDDDHVQVQRDRYRRRLDVLAAGLMAHGLAVRRPQGSFYLWVADPGGDGWALARHLARVSGVVGAPGDLYGPAGAGHVRLAVVAATPRVEAVAERLASPTGPGSPG